MQNLLSHIKAKRCMNAVAAGVTAQNGESVDMQGYDSVMFIASFGTLSTGAVTSIKAQQSTDDSTFADLEGTSISIPQADSNGTLILDINKPEERYIRPVVSRGTGNAVIDGIMAIRYNGRTKPATQDATIIDSESHTSPEEGTA